MASTAVALGSIEVAFYFFGPGYQEQFLMIDAVRGWRLRPGFAGWTADENTLWVRINSDGLRDAEHTRRKPDHTFRVAILGDSYMQGMNVPLEETYASHLQRQLASCFNVTGWAVETVNFGTSGYSTTQEWITYRDQASAYAPDLVLTAFYSGNDVRDNSPVFSDAPAPFLVRDGGDWRLDQSFAETIDQPMSLRTRVRQAITSRFRTATLLYRTYADVRSWIDSEADHDGDQRRWDEDADASRPPDDPDFEAAWQATEAALTRITAAARDAHAEPWIVTLTYAQQVDPDLAKRRALARALGVDDLYYSERRIAKLGATIGAHVVTLAPALAEYTASHHTYINGGLNARTPPGRGHWNATGNRIAAEQTAAAICRDSAAIATLRTH